MAPSRRSGNNNNNENPDIAAIIAQQLQTILPQIVTQVTNNVNNANNGNGGNGGGGNGNGGNNGCTFKAFQSCNPKEVDGKTVEEIETKIIANDGTVTRIPGQFQGYETSEEEPVEQPRRHDLYEFVDHPQLQQGNPMNEFAPHRLPQPEGNMNGWLMEDEEELERNEVDSDLESTASSKPMWKKTTKDDPDRASRNCPYYSK
ncbi:hypothetical protein Tco_1518144 [Tanacetum coccineum]